MAREDNYALADRKPAQTLLARRAFRFLVVGGVTTGVAYVAMMSLLRVMNYLPATVLAWMVTVAVGFVLNRRVTFGIVGPDRRVRDLGVFVVGALLQLLIGEAGYAVMLGLLDFHPTAAFLVVLALNTTFGFAFLNLVTFRRAT